MRTPALALVLLLPACALSTWDPPPRTAMAPAVAAGSTEPLRFGGLGLASMRRGTEIGRYLWGLDCAGPVGREFWTSGRRLREGATWEDRFYTVMADAGFAVTGGAGRFYEAKAQGRRARYTVSAELKAIRLELCRREDWITGADRGISGYGTVTVDWALYDPEAQRLLHRVTTTGSATTDTGLPEGDIFLIEEAFSTAAEGLAADDGFRAAVAKGFVPPLPDAPPIDVPAVAGPMDPPMDGLPAPPVALIPAGLAPLEVDGPPLFDGFVEDAAGRLAAALVPVGSGHGIVVGAHRHDGGGSVLLVPDAALDGRSAVTVRPAAGVALDGTVERRDARLGLALVRVPARLTALPVRRAPPAVSEAVHLATGGRRRTAPGIVGGLRPDPERGCDVLLADLDGPPPRAGDALLDDAGNLAGLALPGGPALPGADPLAAFVPAGEVLRLLGVSPMRAD
ncbi:trypsin-like peptidase domain-containing protein [Azospirillum halopraeferens]|uniref:trypsin-like peptidase domain-containing protein n=1 Tax=Azospirillum halopraeferens TaxID=34010 RepID=UPI0004200300|nr:trypsin-like peptidase domain-containing protein [Azospirillum halopraeferens]